MRQILIGTTNPHKLKEVREILRDLPVELISPEKLAQLPEIIEDGHTFSENAVKKAVEWAKATGYCTMADDSGLEVDALGGEPGVFSARYGGKNTTYEDNNIKLLNALEGVPTARRTARFHCTIALARPEGLIFVVEGECAGIIAEGPRGSHGFGYDPVFYVPECGKTFAELGPEIKNQMSHRTRALKKFGERLLRLLDTMPSSS
ncbi:MAG: XTP/dITP diphosphatase [Candidatus Brocadiales bacterium]|nr:XTP/dITP diphosphatase [Candidatus Bathyanammoxibius amoris]